MITSSLTLSHAEARMNEMRRQAEIRVATKETRRQRRHRTSRPTWLVRRTAIGLATLNR